VFQDKEFVMANEKQQLSEILRQGSQPDQSIGAIEAVKAGIQAIAPGLTLSNILNDVGAELKQMGTHGAHEAVAALFNESAFVMYPRTNQGVDDPQHGQKAEPHQEQERERGGMGM